MEKVRLLEQKEGREIDYLRHDQQLAQQKMAATASQLQKANAMYDVW
jgi:hypothetical protein